MNVAKKDEDEPSLFVGLGKVQVIQEARIFNQSNASLRKCRLVLGKIAYLLNTGETFAPREATELFFSMTKLFQHKNDKLRQMVYVVIEQMAMLAQDTIMVTSIIMKDTTMSSDVLYRPNSIRALCRVIDSTTVPAIERLVKTAIVDKNATVSSAAIVSSYHLLPIARDTVRRWANETQEAVVSPQVGSQIATTPYFAQLGYKTPPSNLTQYHALGLLYQMRHHDRMAITKLIQQLTAKSSTLRHPYSNVLMVRFVANLAHEDPGSRRTMFALLEQYLRNKSDSVSVEAAKAIGGLPDLTDAEAASAIAAMQTLLSSPRFVSRFAAIRVLNSFSMTRPGLVNVANEEIESLITDPNRSIATFAITTLLKTGNESSVDRLMKQIEDFMEEISDEFKVIVVDAVRSLCLKFPKKQAAMVKLLAGILRDEGGYEFKSVAVDAVFDLIKYVPEAKEEALSQLCEFIEDCEFSVLAVRILHLLGVEGPKTEHPTKFIRYIYNRIVLENAVVRAAAVNALARFGIDCQDPELQNSVRVLLRRCLDDADDEVRDRAAIQLDYLDSTSTLLSGSESALMPFIKNDTAFSLPALEQGLVLYVSGDSFDKPFEIEQIPLVTREQADAEILRNKTRRTEAIALPVKNENVDKRRAPGAAAVSVSSGAVPPASLYVESLGKIENFAAYGPVMKSSLEPVFLTEKETEFVVSAVTHVFAEHIVFQFDVENTLTDVLLENVSMATTPDVDGVVQDDFVLPVAAIPPGESGSLYVSFTRLEPDTYALLEFTNALQFTSKEVDPSTGEAEADGYEDEYQIENHSLTAGTYVIPTYTAQFDATWDEYGVANEASQTYVLDSLSSIEEGISKVINTLAMYAVDGTDVPSASEPVHSLKLSGKTIKDVPLLALVRMVYAAKSGVTIKLSVRAADAESSMFLAENF